MNSIEDIIKRITQNVEVLSDDNEIKENSGQYNPDQFEQYLSEKAKINILFNRSNLPKRFLNMTTIQDKIKIASFPEEFKTIALLNPWDVQDFNKSFLAVIDNYKNLSSELIKRGQNLLIIGGSGSGKTRSVVEIAQRAILFHGLDVIFWDDDEFCRFFCQTDFNKSQEKEAELLKIINCDLFVYDDIGSAQALYNNEGFKNRNYIINERYKKNKATVFTSEFPKGELLKMIDARLFTRIIEDCGQKYIVEMKDVKNYRIENAKK